MRTLAVSIGNTSVFAGVFAGERCAASFRVPIEAIERLPRRVRGRIDVVAICSVVPARTTDVIRLLKKAYELKPLVLTGRARHGLKIGYRQPEKLGADRIAAALGARVLYPKKNVVVVDCGTATTVTVLDRSGRIRGGAILPGLTLMSEALASGTAQLPRTKVRRPRAAIGRSPEEGIASGCYFGQIGAIRELVARTSAEAFGKGRTANVVVIGTGGHAPLLAGEKVFTALEPQLALVGLHCFAASDRASLSFNR